VYSCGDDFQVPGFSLNARQTSLLGDVVAAMRSPSEFPVAWSALEGLKDLFHADYVGITSLDSTLPKVVFEQSIDDPLGERDIVTETVVEARVNPFWRRYWDPDAGCSYPDRTGDYDWVHRASDTESLRQRRASYVGDRENFHQRYLVACLPGRSPGRYARLRVFRQTGSDFTERDIFFATLLKPHLESALHKAELRRNQAVLTKRQLDVMRMVEGGLTNRQIATKLGVSEGTVHAHLTEIYARLKVQSRTAAVQAVFATADTLLITTTPELSTGHSGERAN
jgi:DNA-binding CsgD family transcriptional regulator